MFLFLLNFYLEVELLDCVVTHFNDPRNYQLVPKQLNLFTFPLAAFGVSNFLTCPQLLLFSVFLILVGVKLLFYLLPMFCLFVFSAPTHCFPVCSGHSNVDWT